MEYHAYAKDAVVKFLRNGTWHMGIVKSHLPKRNGVFHYEVEFFETIPPHTSTDLKEEDLVILKETDLKMLDGTEGFGA